MATTTRYWQRKLILSKIETTAGTDAVPTPAVNSIEARNVQFTPLEAGYAENNVEVAYYGNSPEMPVSQAAKLTFDVAMQGSGTAGTAPAYGPLLRACAFAEKVLGTPATGTMQGGSATTAQLAAAASAVDDAYKGMRLAITGGTGSGQSSTVLAYNGTNKTCTMVDPFTTPPNATSLYSIAAQVSYAPVSSGFESLTNYMYVDGILHKLLFTRGTVSAKMTPKSLPVWSFEFMSMFTTPTDVALPGGSVLTGFKTPLPVLNSWTSGVTLQGFGANLYDFSLNMANQVIHRDNVIGIDDVLITDRSPSGSIVIQAPLMAEFDAFTPARLATLGAVNITQGTAAGLRSRICIPSTQIKSPKYAQQDKVVTLSADLRPCPVNGNDEVFFIFD